MGEVIFVLKCMVITVALTIGMQLRWGSERLEDVVHREIKQSQAAAWIQSVASGGALFIDRSTRAISVKIDEWMGSQEDAPHSQRAGRTSIF